jgi:hypothetical protein
VVSGDVHSTVTDTLSLGANTLKSVTWALSMILGDDDAGVSSALWRVAVIDLISRPAGLVTDVVVGGEA